MDGEVRPSGVVTFLFTDIEGSTRRWEDDPAGMRAALASHDEVLGSAISSAGGWLFKHTGDGVCAAFTSPSDAVDAAIDAQLGLELPVRMGIATGEAERRGDDYFGPSLNRAARVMDAGHGGQVLVASVAAALVEGVDLLDLGSRRLRDLSEPVELFQVRADGLRAEFPPLRTLDATPGNLRSEPSTFVGRDSELADVVAAVGAHRLVTLTGVGGVGKTRLALRAAAELAPVFSEGVFVVELAAVGDPAAVPEVVASVLGVIQQPGATVAESVAAALGDRERLLVLDNCEHVLDTVAELVEQILARADAAKVLATSREGLRIADEHVWTVPSLEVRAGLDSEAVALFLERATALVKDFSVERSQDRDAVVEICRRLDGIPLAIELAASRIVSMSPADVRDRLDDRFQLLSGSRRGLERHQTLRQAVQWSFDLLDDDERQLLLGCSVFAGGFDVDAAVAVGTSGQADEYAVLDLLDALVRKSLLVVDRSAGRARYSMLETIRQFAEDRLVETDAALAVRTLHAEHYADQIARTWKLWDGPDQAASYAWFHRELANLRTAFRFATDNDMIDAAAAVAIHAGALGYVVEQVEPCIWAEELLPVARALDHPRLAAIYGTAALCVVAGRIDDALEYSAAGLAALDDNDDMTTAMARLQLLLVFPFSGRLDEWVDGLGEIIEHTSDPWCGARACLPVGLALAGRVDEAVPLVEGIVELAEPTDNPWALANALHAPAYALRDVDPHTALEAARRGVEVTRASGNRQQETMLAQILARLEAEHGDPSIALENLEFVIQRYHDSGNVALASGLGVLAAFFNRIGDHEPAATMAGFAALDPGAVAAWPEIGHAIAHLREVLGTEAFESRASEGAAMSPTAVVRYSLKHIHRARAELRSD